MAYSIEVRENAIALRRKGYSLKEISRKFHITKSTASAWMRDVPLTPQAEERLLSVIKKGQLVSAQKKKEHIKAIEEKYLNEAKEEIRSAPNYGKIICAMIYWCEGAKNAQMGMRFINSNPDLVRTFLDLLRENFSIHEDKFHPCIHIHGYHSAEIQLDFWSKITDIDKRQFIKPYLKPNTGKRIRENYQGCIAIRYGSSDLARQLMAVAKAFMNKGA